MCYKKLMVLLCVTYLIASTGYMRAVLAGFKHFKLADSRDLFLLSEFHMPAGTIDLMQLDALSKIYTAKRFSDSKQMHLMVEVPSLLAQERAPGTKVTYEILKRVSGRPGILTQDVEIRCQSLATLHLMYDGNNGKIGFDIEGEVFNAGSVMCKAGDVTPASLLREFEDQYRDIRSEQVPAYTESPVYKKRDAEVVNLYKSLQASLETIAPTLKERMVDIVRAGIPSKFNLDSDIGDLGAYLLDMHIARSILKSKADYCMLIAGNLHCVWISKMMKSLGAKKIASIKQDDPLCPLTEKQFNLIASALT